MGFPVMLPLIALLLLLPVLILGIVLFIVGLVKKKPAMWGSGIAIGVLGLLVLTVGAGMLVFFGVRRAQTQALAQAVAQIQTDAQATQAELMRDLQPLKDFHGTTGLDLPNGVSVTGTSSFFHLLSVQDDSAQLINVNMRRMSVPADFNQFLAANFTEAQWATVASSFQIGRSRTELILPSDSQLQAMSLYSLTAQPDPNLPAIFTTAIAHDADQQQAWMVIVDELAPTE